MRLRILGLVLLVGLLSRPAFATSVSPETTTVNADDTFFLDINITGVTDLFAYQFDVVSFNPAILSANSIEEGAFLATAGSTFPVLGDIDNIAGTISLTGSALISAISGASGDGVLARISFTALAEGTATISLSDVVLLDSSLTDIPADVADGSVTVLPAAPPSGEVPEPSTIVLLGTGLAAAYRRRRSTRAA